jgi:tetratricopeptide (TPR) repeat protein
VAPSIEARARLLGSACAALFFAMHPLRAESVAWVTERRDVLSGLFFLIAILCYLVSREDGRARPRLWVGLSVAAFALACLSKSIVVTLPALLLLLDVYPLRRLDARPWTWAQPASRSVLIEKLPYIGLAGATAAMAIHAQIANRYLTPFDALPLLARIPVALNSLWFYISKTVVPVALSPLYELPATINPLESRFLVAAGAVISLTALFVLLRRDWPAGLAAWIAYALTLLPVSGLVHNGHQLAHDRYSYLSCLPWALVFGGGISVLLDAGRRHIIREMVARAAFLAGALWLGGLSLMTWHQIGVWRDNDTLWRYALDADPDCAICHANLGVSLSNQQLLPAAIERFEKSTALRPDRVRTQGNLGLALLATGRPVEAAARFENVLAKYPADNDTRVNLAMARLQTQQRAEAIVLLREALARDPHHVYALTNMGAALVEDGDGLAAVDLLERAAQAKPRLPQPRIGLMRAYAALGRYGDAERQLEALRSIEPSAAQVVGPALVTVW